MTYKFDHCFCLLKAIEWGRAHEETAIEQYQTATGNTVQSTGMFLSPCGVLGGSPDGKIIGGGLVEVKCPWKHRNKTVAEAALSDKNFCLEITDDGTFRLKDDHIYIRVAPKNEVENWISTTLPLFWYS